MKTILETFNWLMEDPYLRDEDDLGCLLGTGDNITQGLLHLSVVAELHR
jgi:hypothetical protein